MIVAVITIVTKSGGVLHKTIKDVAKFNFDKWLCDRIQHEHGMIPVDCANGQGRISIDCIARIQCELC